MRAPIGNTQLMPMHCALGAWLCTVTLAHSHACPCPCLLSLPFPLPTRRGRTLGRTTSLGDWLSGVRTSYAGGIARFVLLPHEGHGYQARESILHVLAEQHEWLTRWVIDKEPKPAAPAAPAQTLDKGRGQSQGQSQSRGQDQGKGRSSPGAGSCNHPAAGPSAWLVGTAVVASLAVAMVRRAISRL